MSNTPTERHPQGELPTIMRAVSYTRYGPAADVLTMGMQPVPILKHGQALIRVHASGVNPHDTKKRSGWIGEGAPTNRVIPHSDGAGIVVAVGPGVPHERVGERVFVNLSGVIGGDGHPDGTAAEFVAVPCGSMFPLPPDFSFYEGAAIGIPAFTAFYAVLGDGPVTGQTILVQGGAGAVGQVAIQFALWNGADVIATVSSPEKAVIVGDLGVEHIIDYRLEDVGDRVAELTKGQGVERIVEVDFGANIGVNARCLKGNGTIASYSSTRVREPILPYYALASRGARLNLLQAGNMPPAIRTDAARTIVALMRQGLLHPRVTEIVPFGETARAHELVEAGTTIGNIVVDQGAD